MNASTANTRAENAAPASGADDRQAVAAPRPWVRTRCGELDVWTPDPAPNPAITFAAFVSAPVDLAFHKHMARSDSEAHRRDVAARLGLPADRLAHTHQLHHARLVSVPPLPPADHPDLGFDGLATATPNVPLMAFSADCPLVLLVDEAKPAICVVHAGWRGIMRGVIASLAQGLRDNAGNPSRARAWVAPCAHACCYEIQEDVASQVREASANPDRCLPQRDGEQFFDMQALISEKLMKEGVPADRIHLAAQCTICSDDFYSYRRQGKGCGHSALIACLK